MKTHMCIICRGENVIGLTELNCYKCPILTSIPHIEGLQILRCSNCPLLTSIPHIEGLLVLDCSNCSLLTSIPDIQGLQFVLCRGCPFLNHIQNPDFQSNLTKIERIQQWYRRNRQIKKTIIQTKILLHSRSGLKAWVPGIVQMIGDYVSF